MQVLVMDDIETDGWVVKTRLGPGSPWQPVTDEHGRPAFKPDRNSQDGHYRETAALRRFVEHC